MLEIKIVTIGRDVETIKTETVNSVIIADSKTLLISELKYENLNTCKVKLTIYNVIDVDLSENEIYIKVDKK